MSAAPGTRPVLVFACGNPSRGDDSLGPLLIERLAKQQRAGDLRQVDLLTDFQLQVEHAMDLKDRELVVFADATASGPEPFAFSEVHPETEIGYTTHSMSPGAVLRVFEQVTGGDAPPARLLAIRGYAFNLGSPMSAAAGANLSQAGDYLSRLLRKPEPPSAPKPPEAQPS